MAKQVEWWTLTLDVLKCQSYAPPVTLAPRWTLTLDVLKWGNCH